MRRGLLQVQIFLIIHRYRHFSQLLSQLLIILLHLWQIVVILYLIIVMFFFAFMEFFYCQINFWDCISIYLVISFCLKFNHLTTHEFQLFKAIWFLKQRYFLVWGEFYQCFWQLRYYLTRYKYWHFQCIAETKLLLNHLNFNYW